MSSYYERHIFFCLNRATTAKKCCADHGAKAGFDHCKARNQGREAGRAGRCARQQGGLPRPLCRRAGGGGLPEAVWYTYVDQHDIDEIVDSHLKNGQVVERLLLPPDVGADELADRRQRVAGPAGDDRVRARCTAGAPRGVAVSAIRIRVHGGTMDNKVVITLARAFLQLGCARVRFNFRGVGGSAGRWDEGRGEVDDALAVIAAQRDAASRFMLAGFSFGGYVASQAARRAAEAQAARWCWSARRRRSSRCRRCRRHVVSTARPTTSCRCRHARLGAAAGLPVIVLPGVGHFLPRAADAAQERVVQQLLPPRLTRCRRLDARSPSWIR
jgi:alpha/beta superfamily hydrolase